MMVQAYDAKAHILTCGNAPIMAFAEGSKITVVRESNETTDVAGVDGDVVVAEMHDPRATMTVTLHSTSPSNDLLSGYANGRLKFPVMLRDMNGSTVISGLGWVQRRPDVEVSAEAPSRAWEIRIAASQYHVGGNPIIGAGAVA